jgi:hypothetical protein
VRRTLVGEKVAVGLLITCAAVSTIFFPPLILVWVLIGLLGFMARRKARLAQEKYLRDLQIAKLEAELRAARAERAAEPPKP